MANDKQTAGQTAQQSKPATATVETATATVAHVEPAKPTRTIRFSKPEYEGKPDDNGKIAKPYRAEAVITGLFGTEPIQCSGFALQQNGTDMLVHMPFTNKTYRGVAAFEPATVPYTDAELAAIKAAGVDLGDNPMRIASGGSKRLDDLKQAIRDAWALANQAGKPYGVSYPLNW